VIFTGHPSMRSNPGPRSWSSSNHSSAEK